MALSHVMNLVSNSGLVGAGNSGAGGGGGGGNLDTQVVTVGTDTGGGQSGTRGTEGFGGFAGGSISDGTSNIYGGAAITRLSYEWETDITFEQELSELRLVITGAHANSGWTTLTVGSTAYLRTNAAYIVPGGAETVWIWIGGADPNGTSSPFGPVMGQTNCVFT